MDTQVLGVASEAVLSSTRGRCFALLAVALSAWLVIDRAAAQNDSFRFVILGDRTGEARPGVYERVWRAAAAEDPAFAVSVGDSIEGLNDATAEDQWRQLERILTPYRRIPLFLAPGNHDIWSAQSQAAFEKHAGHAPHYGFDRGQVHVTVLDNSRSDTLPMGELRFLEQDLAAHKDQPVKFIVMHRPSWLVDAMLQNPNFPLHQLAKRYGVQWVIAGHLHQMLEVDLEGVTYLSMASAGGHLRGSERYEDGWFFGYAVAQVRGNTAGIQIKELGGRVSAPKDWRRIGANRVGTIGNR
ncbi:MAG: metallophosphoesterase [Acidobacteriota bacterium]|nr:metallophosphoesterase [Acidobacteriota bacterium]